MVLELDDTIAALASAPGPGARGIVRLSGPAVVEVLDGTFRATAGTEWKSLQKATCVPGEYEVPGCQASLPVALYFWPTRRSYTGQRMAELHTIGSPPLLETVLAALFDVGARPARPGEFTLRAFLAGRIDLVQAEAVLGVIDAQDHEELQLALGQLAGGVSSRIVVLQNDLIELLADLEAGLDFVEEDIEFIDRATVVHRIQAMNQTLEELREASSGRMHTTGRWRVVLAGLPNAGKSTLFNSLTGHESAIVSETKGTTRDYLTAPLDWDGLPIELIDTAGWKTEANELESGAQELRSEQMEQADLIIWCSATDLEVPAADENRTRLRELQRQGALVLPVRSKADLTGVPRAGEGLAVSAVTRDGLETLKTVAAERLVGPEVSGRQMLGTTASRCHDSLAGAVRSLDHAITAARSNAGEELIAIELREALDHLGQILGAVYTDDILDRIFSKFCIGK